MFAEFSETDTETPACRREQFWKSTGLWQRGELSTSRIPEVPY
jgi:hypothetical protein